MQKLGTRLARYWTLGWMLAWVLGSLGFGSVKAQPQSGQDAWVDRTLNQLTLRQKIGQLIMVPVFAQADTADAQVLGLIRDYEVGGLIWMKGKSVKLPSLLQQYKKASTHPLWMAMDAEWGAAMRLDDRPRFPYAMTMGACQDTDLVEALAEAMGRELKELGMHISFGPVADVNSNPFNPVIGFRSFGSEPRDVLAMALAYARGLEKAGMMSCAKHFPGHGDTELDSHHDLPVLDKSRESLDSVELSTFRGLLGLPSMMSAHLIVQALDSGLALPVSLNPAALEGLLRRQWGYEGVIFSDALNMKGASQCYPPGELEWKALQAGNDVLLYVTDVPKAIQRIEQALLAGEWTEADLNQKVCRILRAKYRYVLNGFGPSNDPESSNDPAKKGNHAKAALPPSLLQERCFGKSLTLWNPTGSVLPEWRPEGPRLYLALGGDSPRDAYNRFGIYAQADFLHWPWKGAAEPDFLPVQGDGMSLDSILCTYPEWVVAWHVPSQRWSTGLGMDSLRLQRWKGLMDKARSKGIRMVHLLFGNPLALTRMQVKETTLCAYEDRPEAYNAAVQALFGATDAPGLWPIRWPATHLGLGTNGKRDPVLRWQPRIQNQSPQGRLVLSSRCLAKADSLVETARKQGAFPGAQLLVAQGERILMAKAYGSTDTSGLVPVDMGHVYDLASLTKVLSTALAAMHLHSLRPLPLQSTMGSLLPELKKHPLGSRKLATVLTHQAGLASHIPFQTMLGSDTNLARVWSQLQQNPALLRDSLEKRILALPLDPEGNYRYSDLGLLWVEKWLQKEYLARYGMDYRSYLTQAWYQPCGASRLGFVPTLRLPLHRLVPTELDTLWRKTTVHGKVHDPMADLMGGVAPHAGLFGTAADVARVMMPLVTGYFPGSARVDASTVSRFTTAYFAGNRRGLLWDKPLPGSTQAAAPRSFGHSGFTGTYVWTDPETGLILVFLSNRIHPKAEPNLLARSNLRTDLWDLFYKEVKASANPSSRIP